ncbi:pyruvate kinase [Natranaerofaba carboxydovora]|uniref:pyruvate kinase n=1 Tax=Natranaerofaba carboxydovora TaxID=2742683 RepID=UPI001F143D7B|nr:pyruvate kinase [Natranaerofaba carboxydovora]UMZ74493.1 Pyruvate kinase [Natranaerofaba carboxydovora]
MNDIKKTKIVATIGPSSEDKAVFAKMVENGADVVRINFSHGEKEKHRENIRMVKEVFDDLGRPGAVVVDTKGPEIRLKDFEGGETWLEEGQEFVLTKSDILGDSYRAAINLPEIIDEIKPGITILLDDGMIELLVNEIKDNGVHCLVKNSGVIKDKKSVSIPGAHLSIPVVTEKDKEDLDIAISESADFIAASFIRNAEDILEVRKVLENKGSNIPIISKIETKESVEHLDEILEVSDGVMVARGDLGVEIQAEDVPLIQKRIIRKANHLGKPVITATQMLESMTNNPRPTRAEASDVANAIFDGTDAVMLSGETAIGKYPIETVRTMYSIVKRTEDELFDNSSYYSKNREKQFESSAGNTNTSVTDAIAFSTCQMALSLGTRAILTSTQSGYTARMVAKYKPSIPVLAVTPCKKIVRRLNLSWGVYPLLCEETNETDEMFSEAISTSLKAGYLKNGDLVILTAGVPVGISGTTNLIRVHTVGQIKTSGTGIGKKPSTGRINIIDSEEKINRISGGDIIVVDRTTRNIVPKLSNVEGIIAVEDGLTCKTAIIGIELNIPVVVGVKKAFEALEEGEVVTIDPFRGLVYEGEAVIL